MPVQSVPRPQYSTMASEVPLSQKLGMSLGGCRAAGRRLRIRRARCRHRRPRLSSGVAPQATSPKFPSLPAARASLRPLVARERGGLRRLRPSRALLARGNLVRGRGAGLRPPRRSSGVRRPPTARPRVSDRLPRPRTGGGASHGASRCGGPRRPLRYAFPPFLWSVPPRRWGHSTQTHQFGLVAPVHAVRASPLPHPLS